VFWGKLRINSGVLRVARGGSGAKAPLLAARPSTVQETGQILDCSFYLPVSMSRDDPVGPELSTLLKTWFLAEWLHTTKATRPNSETSLVLLILMKRGTVNA